ECRWASKRCRTCSRTSRAPLDVSPSSPHGKDRRSWRAPLVDSAERREDGLGGGASAQSLLVTQGDVTGANPAVDHAVDGGFKSSRLIFEPEGMTQEQRGAQNRGERIGDSLSGDIGC